MPQKAPSLDPGAQGSAGSAPLSADDLAMMKKMRVSEEVYRRSRDALTAQQQKK